MDGAASWQQGRRQSTNDLPPARSLLFGPDRLGCVLLGRNAVQAAIDRCVEHSVAVGLEETILIGRLHLIPHQVAILFFEIVKRDSFRVR